jgi:general stress protein 26
MPKALSANASPCMNPVVERHRVREVLQRAGVAILVTLDSCGAQDGRPMLPLWLPDDPHIYFLTHRESRKVSHIGERPQVVLTITSAHCYFVVLGSAYASRDPELIRRLWRPSYRAWFPAGKDNREATALRMVIDRVNYWEPPRSQFVRVFQAVKAMITRRAVETPMKTLDGL